MITSAIIPAAGSGLRFGEKKQFKNISGKPLIYHTLIPFISSKMIDEVIVAASNDDMNDINSVIKTIKTTKPLLAVEGSLTRQASIRNALKAINKQSQRICIHDAVRPFIKKELMKYNTKFVPLDSEHFSIWSLLKEENINNVKKFT